MGGFTLLSGHRRATFLARICGVLAGALMIATAAAQAAPDWGTGLRPVLPGDAAANPAVRLTSVSCPSAGNCAAVGLYKDVAGHTQGLLLDETNGLWATGLKAQLPAGVAADPNVLLRSVSCGAPGDCGAVGTYIDGTGHRQGLLLHEAGGVWAAGQKLDPPSGASPSDPGVDVFSVSCAGPGECTAVGIYNDTSAYGQGLVVTETGGVWASASRAAPPPGTSAANPAMLLRSVSCTDAADCAAVGSYKDNQMHTQGVLLSESGGGWTSSPAALPAGAGTDPKVALEWVSCSAPGGCGAVGAYADGAGHTQGLLLTEKNGAWLTGTQAVLPSGIALDPFALLTSISCTAPGSCSAVGEYFDTAGRSQGVLLTQSGGTWGSGVEAKLSDGDSTRMVAQSVSCSAAGRCSAVGYHPTLDGGITAAMVSETDGTWGDAVATTLPSAQSSPPLSAIQPVSCATADQCTAVGSFRDATGATQPLIVGVYADPTLALSAPTGAVAGGTVTAASVTATLAGGPGASGTVAFVVFGPQPTPPSECTSGGTALGGAPVAGDGAYAPPAGFTPPAAGDYWWYATYGGDGDDHPAASPCGAGMPETMVSAPPTALGGVSPAGPSTVATATAHIERITVKGSRVRVALSCAGPSSARCVVALALTAHEKLRDRHVVAIGAARRQRHHQARSRARSVTLATGGISLAGGQSATVVLVVGHSGRALLTRFHRIVARLVAAQQGHRIAARQVTLRVKPRHRRPRRRH